MGAYSALHWWRVTLGVPLPVDDELKTPRSATVLPLLALRSLVRLAAGPLRLSIQARRHRLVFTLVGICIRWRSAQRSVLEGVSGTLIIGKRRVQGSPPAFRWAAPWTCGNVTCSHVHLCHLLLCQHCTCVHFRRALETQAKRCFHISHHIGLHRSAHCELNPHW